MRDNGLDAVAYAAIGDVDRRITDAVLALLADGAIAAYVEPETDDETVERDRLYVDETAVDQALEILQREIPVLRGDADAPADRTTAAGADEPGVDEAAWADIVAAYNRDLGDAPVGPWPAQEDLDSDRTDDSAEDTAEDSGDSSGEHGDDPADSDADSSGGTLTATRVGSSPGSEQEEHFVPPDPPPLPELDTVSKAAWAGLLGGPALLLLIVLTDWSVPGWVRAAAVAAGAVGFLTLVFRSRDTGGDGDNGAVV